LLLEIVAACPPRWIALLCRKNSIELQSVDATAKKFGFIVYLLIDK